MKVKKIKFSVACFAFLCVFSLNRSNVSAVEDNVGNIQNAQVGQNAETTQTTKNDNIADDSWKEHANEPLDNAVPIIYKYEIDGDGYIVPGEEFTLKFTVYNPAVVSKLGNIRIVVSQEESLVYPQYKNTNSVFIGYLLPLSYAEGEVRLRASDYINSEQIIVNVNMSYTDNYYTNNQQQLTAVLPVSPNGKISISSVDIPSNVYVGSNNRLSISYQNNGLSPINEVVLHMIGDTIDEQEVSLGGIGSGSNMSSDVYLTFAKAGEQTVKVYFTYTDNKGQSYETEESEYNFDVKEYDSVTASSDNYDASRIRMNRVLTFAVLLGSLGLVGTYFYLVLRKRKREAALIKGESK